jgi:hypothetical protein
VVPDAHVEIRKCPKALARLHARIFGSPAPAPPAPDAASSSSPPPAPSPSWQPHGLADEEILRRARAAKDGGKFSRLWSGDTSDHGGDDSRADLALCSLLAYWCGPDHERIDRLFRRSDLMQVRPHPWCPLC